MPPRRHRATAAWLAAALLCQGACPVAVAPQASLDFACVDDRDCVRPSVCLGNVCVAPSTVDASLADQGSQERGPAERLATDLHSDTGAPQDTTGSDLRADAAVAPDVADAAHGDSAGATDLVADAGPDLDGTVAAPDATAATDAALVDLTTEPDATAPPEDGGLDASAAPDSAVEDLATLTDTAVPPDTAVADTALPDTTQPDTAGPDTAGPDTARLSCFELYGGITAYMLCAETDTSCTVFARMSQSCDAICQAFGGTCLSAYADASDTCGSGGDVACDAVMGDGVCTCSRP